MNKILKVFLSLLLLVGLSKQILSYEVTIIWDGFVYTCFTYPGTNEVDISTCMANVKEVIICAEPLCDAGVDDVGGGASGGTTGGTTGTGITPGGGGGTPTDPVDPVDPDPIVINPDEEALIIDCDCKECQVCGFCLVADLPLRCKKCICPEPPEDKIDLCNMSDIEVVNGIRNWFIHVCKLRDINSDINIKLSDVMADYQCFDGGFGGTIKNGSVTLVGGINVRWQIQFDSYDHVQNEYLKFRYFDEEPRYFKVALIHDGDKGEPGIVVNFNSAEEREMIFGNIHCIYEYEH